MAATAHTSARPCGRNAYTLDGPPNEGGSGSPSLPLWRRHTLAYERLYARSLHGLTWIAQGWHQIMVGVMQSLTFRNSDPFRGVLFEEQSLARSWSPHKDILPIPSILQPVHIPFPPSLSPLYTAARSRCLGNSFGDSDPENCAPAFQTGNGDRATTHILRECVIKLR